MEVLGVIFLVVIALLLLGALTIGAFQLPEIRRYLKIRSM